MAWRIKVSDDAAHASNHSALTPLPKKTRKEIFLEAMNQVVRWAALVELIRPYDLPGFFGPCQVIQWPDQGDVQLPICSGAMVT